MLTALRLLVTLALLAAPCILYVAATARAQRGSMIFLMYPMVLAIPTAIGGLLVLAPLEAILDARGQGRLKDVVVPAAGALLVLVVLGVTWRLGRQRRARIAARDPAAAARRRRDVVLSFVAGGVAGVVWGAAWRLSARIARDLLARHA